MLHAKKKKKHGFFLGLAVLAAALALAGCENLTAGGNTGATGQPGETTGAMGSLTLKIGIDGIISSSMSAQTAWAGAAGVPGVSRTVYPDSIGITGYKLEFEPTSGGAAHAPETTTGNTVTIDLIVGSYTITVTAFSGSTAIAGGIKSNVTVSKDQTTQVSVTLGPKEEAGNGSFVWDLTLPNGVDNPVLYVTTLDNHALSGGTITLTAGQQNQGTLSLASGYYKARLELTMGSKVAGFSGEFIHIYGGLTSTLAKVFTADDFVEVKTVDDFNLTGYFPAPVWGAEPQTLFEGSRYNGVIQWKNGGLTHSGAFAADTVYTAVISLTAKTGYTFDGVWVNQFSHSGIWGTSAANSGNVTIVFNRTATTGGINIDIGFNHGEIEVSGSNGENLIEHFNQPNTLTLSVSGYENISWYVDSGTSAQQGNPLTLRGIDYTMGKHIVTFNGYKDGVPFSQMIPFRVTDTTAYLNSIQAAESYLSNIGDNSADNPAVLPLEIDLSGGGWQNLLGVIAAAGKYVNLDLSLSAMAGMEFNPDSAVSTGKDLIVSLVLPNGANRIKAGDYSASTFKHFTSLKRVDGGSIVNIGDYAFSVCYALTTANFPLATSIGYSAFGGCAALATANFPAATSIGDNAFNLCYALTIANFPLATFIGEYAFNLCEVLTTANFPAATSIGERAFSYCAALTIANFPAADSIGYSAFSDCAVLTTANFPAATSIGVGGYAFDGCLALTTANFPAATSIGSNAFNGCANMTAITINETCAINSLQGAGRFLNFKTLYNSNGQQAGTYTYADNAWTKN